jgi:GT2 family glycosyltransferase
MKLSVVILNYKVPYFLELCLQSVSAAIDTFEAEIIVIDNNSQDGSLELVTQKFPQVKYIENKENLGFSKANNIAVSQAKGEYVCILNPDTVLTEDTFIKILNFADQHKDLGIVGCRLIDGQGIFLPESKRQIPTPSVSIKKMLGFTKSYYNTTISEFEIGENPVFVGAFMVLKRDVYNEVNGFDEAYFMYGEDIDFSYKILKSGYKNYYYGEITCVHYKGESTLKDAVYAKRFYGAMQIFYKKHFKSNSVFDGLVWLGIQAAKLMSSSKAEDEKEPQHYTLVSKSQVEKLKLKLLKPILCVSEVTKIQKNTEVVFNANNFSFKEIIDYFSTSEKNKGLTFKIIPKNSNFILGSNSSKKRGEIIHF